MPIRALAVAATLTTAALSLAGCAGVDRAGNEPAPATITLLAVNPLAPLELNPFLRTVARLSHGTIRIKTASGWHVGDVRNEAEAVRYVQTGHADLAFVPVRAWHDVGVRSFDALIAPFAVDSYALQRQVLASGLTARMLHGVAALGLTGLGILPGPIRKPVGVSGPLVDPTDYRNATIGISSSAVAARFFAQLGATPTALPFYGRPIDTVDGIEQQIDSVQGDRYDQIATSITANVNLWPRPIAVVANTKAFDRLTTNQRRVLQQAAGDALDETLRLEQGDEQYATATLCRRGRVRFVNASTAQRDELLAASRPTLTWLERDAGTRDLLARIATMRKGSSVVAAETRPSCEGIAPDQPSLTAASGKPSPMDGTWTMSETRADVIAAGAPADEPDSPENEGDWVLIVDRGRFAFTQQHGPACTWGYGTWIVDGDQVEWRFIDGGGIAPTGAANKPGDLFDYRWSVFHDTLTLATAPGAISPENFLARPWQRVSKRPERSRFFSRCGLPAAGRPY